MPIGRVILLVLAFPVGLAAYLVTGTLLTNAGIAGGLGGLLLVIPFIDYKAKQALADRPSTADSDTPRD